jgi:predicted DsbA family dithiol-disulfide isomerase
MADAAPPTLTVDVWSDYVCPFCYLELPFLHRLKHALAARVDIVWHAFELRPTPTSTLDPDGAYLRDIWVREVYPMARERGMPLRLPPVQPRSRKAFEAAMYARDHDRFDAMHEALFHAFFIEGKDIEDTETLLDIAASVGLEMDPLKDALDVGRYTHRVLDEEKHAQHAGVSGVPLIALRRTGDSLSKASVLRGAVSYEDLYTAAVQLLDTE